MEFRKLGQTELVVSRLGFGSLTIGPLQANLSPAEGGSVIRSALEAGINLIDTAELYNNYLHINKGISGFAGNVIISSRSYAYEYQDMEKSVRKACKELNREYIDIFGLHEQTSRLTLKGHRPALEYLIKAKQEGIIRAIGVSTHAIEVVRAAALIPEIDIIHRIVNRLGLGIIDGDIKQMLEAIEEACAAGKGIYGMKALGGGHLGQDAQQAFSWVLEKPIASIVVGMQSVDEVAVNCALFSGLQPPPQQAAAVAGKKRRLLIEKWCIGCENCVNRCQMGALQLNHGKAEVDSNKCVLCGYCASVCPEFCLKVL